MRKRTGIRTSQAIGVPLPVAGVNRHWRIAFAAAASSERLPLERSIDTALTRPVASTWTRSMTRPVSPFESASAGYTGCGLKILRGSAVVFTPAVSLVVAGGWTCSTVATCSEKGWSGVARGIVRSRCFAGDRLTSGSSTLRARGGGGSEPCFAITADVCDRPAVTGEGAWNRSVGGVLSQCCGVSSTSVVLAESAAVKVGFDSTAVRTRGDWGTAITRCEPSCGGAISAEYRWSSPSPANTRKLAACSVTLTQIPHHVTLGRWWIVAMSDVLS